MRNYIKLLCMISIAFLPACTPFNCGGGGDTDNPGDTKIERTEFTERLANEMAIIHQDCAPGSLIAKGRDGKVIDLCSSEGLTFAVLPPGSIQKVLRAKKIPLETWIKELDEKSFGMLKYVKGAQENIWEARQAKWATDIQATSTYWAIKRRHPHFLRRYTEGLPYPEPGTKAYDEDMRLAADLTEADEKAGYEIDYTNQLE